MTKLESVLLSELEALARMGTVRCVQQAILPMYRVLLISSKVPLNQYHYLDEGGKG